MLATLERARTLDHPYTLAFARHFIASYFQWRGDVERVREVAGVSSPGAAEDDIEITRALAAVCRGWLAFEDGMMAGVEEMRAGIAAYRSHANEFGAPTFLALLAETYGRAGQAREGLAVVAEALQVAERSGAHFWDAELKRLEAVLLLASGGTRAVERKAEACLVAAVEVARGQGARLLVLRATTGLARVWRRRGRVEEARAALAEAYAGFSGAFEARDVGEARGCWRSFAVARGSSSGGNLAASVLADEVPTRSVSPLTGC